MLHPVLQLALPRPFQHRHVGLPGTAATSCGEKRSESEAWALRSSTLRDKHETQKALVCGGMFFKGPLFEFLSEELAEDGKL